PDLNVTTMVYDISHRLTAWVTPLGNRTSYAYDASNKLKKVTTPDGQVTSFTYTTTKTVVTDPKGAVTTLTLSGSSLVGIVDPKGNRTSFTWASSRLASAQDARGNRTSFTYATMNDQSKRLDTIKLPDANTFQYQYNTATGKLARIIDEAGKLTSLVWATAPRTVKDALGNVTSYTYNTRYQITSIKNALGYLATLVYD